MYFMYNTTEMQIWPDKNVQMVEENITKKNKDKIFLEIDKKCRFEVEYTIYANN